MEILHFTCAELTFADICLVDKELDVGIKFLVYDALKFVGRYGRAYRTCIGKSGGSHYAVGHFDTRKHILLASLTHRKRKEQLALTHFGVIYILNRNGDRTSLFIINHRIVSAHFLALKSIGGRSHFHTFKLKIRSDGDFRIFLEELSRDISRHSPRNLVTDNFQRIRIH